MRAVIYARVSTEEQADRGHSLEDQVTRCEARARELGASEILVFTDPGISGSLWTRPGLTAAREAVKHGAAFFICWDPDRFSRNLSLQLVVTEEIEKAGTRLEFLNFEWKNTPEGRLFYSLRGAIAEYEREKIKERTLRGKMAKARKGGLTQYYRAVGYRYDRETDALQIDPVEAQAVKDIYRWFVSEPEIGFTAIARRLEDMGHRPARNASGRWDRSTVKGILANEIYIGRAYVHRYDAAGSAYNKHLPPEERRGYRERPREEWIEIPAPAIIDEITWRAAQHKLGLMGRLRGGHRGAFYLLSRLVYCGCGQGMSGKLQVPDGRKRYRYYCCNSTRRGQGCGAPQVKADEIEWIVWDRVKSWLTHPESFRAEMRKLLPDDTRAAIEREQAQLDAEITQARKGRDGLLHLVQKGAVDPIEVERLLSENLQTLNRLKVRRRELGDQLVRHDLAEQDAQTLLRLSAEFGNRIDRMEPVERQRLIRMLIERVTVHVVGRIVVTARIRAMMLPEKEKAPCTQSGGLVRGGHSAYIICLI